MPQRRQPPQNELEHLRAEPDGRVVRDAGRWANEKLAIVSAYCRNFTTASKTARGGAYLDAFCGPGINTIRDTGNSVWGSGMLAVRTQPPFEQLRLMDLDPANVAALTTRIGDDQRVLTRQGNANEDFLAFVAPVLQSRAPAFCLLDPHGIELHWATVAALGRPRLGAYRCELLILISDRMGYMRLLPVEGEPTQGTVERMNAFFGGTGWLHIYRAKQRGEIPPEAARGEYVALYAAGLRSLGYRYVLSPRDVRDRGVEGRPLYQLIFATDSDAGQRIMQDLFDWMTPLQAQQRLL